MEPKVGTSAAASLERGASAGATIKESGYLRYELVGPDGEVKQVVESENALTEVGAQYILSIVKPGSPVATDTSLFLGVIGSTGTPAADDTMGAHSTWTEVTAADYARISWAPSTVGAGPPAELAFTCSFTEATVTYIAYGAFLNTELTGTSGTLIAHSLLSGGASISVAAADTLNITFKITLA